MSAVVSGALSSSVLTLQPYCVTLLNSVLLTILSCPQGGTLSMLFTFCMVGFWILSLFDP